MSSSKRFKWHLYNNRDNLWPKLQLDQTLFTGVIATPPFKAPKWAQIAPEPMNQKHVAVSSGYSRKQQIRRSWKFTTRKCRWMVLLWAMSDFVLILWNLVVIKIHFGPRKYFFGLNLKNSVNFIWPGTHLINYS